MYKVLLFISLLAVGYFAFKTPKIIVQPEILLDSIFVTKVDSFYIEGKAESKVEFDTILKIDTLLQIDTVYVVKIDTSSNKFKINGATYWRKQDRSTYKLNIWLYPDTIETRLEYLLPDSVRAYMSVNSKVYLDSSIIFKPIVKEKWYENNYLWFGAGMISLGGIIYLVK